tara:strand:+ start:801 stop:1037 length:237 start_codon:yes stop_codon:yes gene_type:complete
MIYKLFRPHPRIIYTCKECSGTNITQELSIFLDPTDCGSIDVSEGIWNDEFWCDDCEDLVDVVTQTTKENNDAKNATR